MDNLQRIDEEQHQEQQHAVEEDGQRIFRLELAEERVVLDQIQQISANVSAKGMKPRRICFRPSNCGHLERNHEQRQRKAEDGVAEALDA